MKYSAPLSFIFLSAILFSCSPSRQISSSAKHLIKGEGFKNAHLGISIYDAESNKTLYTYQAEKYFVPASNTKLFSLYAGLKYLKDSIPGIRYRETADTFFVEATGDPSFLHPDFSIQPVVKKLQQVRKPVVLIEPRSAVSPFGMGWAWDDYNSSYMAERSALPVYGNVIRWTQSAQANSQEELGATMQTFVFSEPDVSWKVRFIEDTANKTFSVKRKRDDNYFEIFQGKESRSQQDVPFRTNGVAAALELLKDTIHQEVSIQPYRKMEGFQTLYSQHADSLYKPMMHESDNFFAEQVLLMSAGAHLDVLDEERMIDHLLKNDLNLLPQKPKWVDGSGLSRYNLFTPADFIAVLDTLRKAFTLERLKTILPTGDEGTLEGYYQNHHGSIYAKTGTLSGTVALSGYLITKKKRLLIFSVLVNNHQASASAIRREIEAFITRVIKKN